MVTGFPGQEVEEAGSCVTCLPGQGRNNLDSPREQPQIPYQGCSHPSFGAQTCETLGKHPQMSLNALWVPQPITGRWLWDLARRKMLLSSCLKTGHGNLGMATGRLPGNCCF